MHQFLGDYAFMGSLIIKEVVNQLLTKGLDKAKVLLLAGSRSVKVFLCAHVCVFYYPIEMLTTFRHDFKIKS